MEGGWVGSTSSGYTDCPNDCIYMWTPSGSKVNLSTSNPNRGNSEQYPKAHNGYVIWIDTPGSTLAAGTYTLYSVANGTYSRIEAPSNAGFYLGNTNIDFAVVNGVINFFYWSPIVGSGNTKSYDIFKWASDSLTSTALSSGGFKSIYPQTDGQRVAWIQTPMGSTDNGLATLNTQSISGGAINPVSSSMLNFNLSGGVLAWTEGNISTVSQGSINTTTTTITALKASTTSGPINTVSNLSSVVLLGVGGGGVVYVQQNKVYFFNASTLVSTVLIDSVPTQTLISGNTMLFTFGKNQSVYQLFL